MRRTASSACLAFTCLSSSQVNAFIPHLTTSHPSPTTTTLHAILPEHLDLTHHALTSATTLLSTIDSDIASIPDDQFRKVFAGGGLIMFGSLLSTMFVGYLIESNNSYADLVAETYAGQDLDEQESFLDSLSFEQRREAEDMVYDFREKKARKAGTWTEEDEAKKRERLARNEEERMKKVEEKDIFSDYD
jgi:hypothetical protein